MNGAEPAGPVHHRGPAFWITAAGGWGLIAWGLRGVVHHHVDTRPGQLLRHGLVTFGGMAYYYLPGASLGWMGWRMDSALLAACGAVLLALATLAIPGYMTHYCRAFDIRDDGTLGPGRDVADGIGSGDLAVGDLVDGMKLDERGNIWVTGPGEAPGSFGVCVFSPEGEHLGTVEVPEAVGNINWGGPDWSWLFIAASSSMFRLPCKVSGNRLPYMR